MNTARQLLDASKLPFTVTVHGLPVTKGSLTPIIVGGPQCPACGGKRNARAVVIEKKSGAAREALKCWRLQLRTIIKAEWNRQGRAMLGAKRGKYLKPLFVSMTFYLPRPKSAPSYVVWPTTYPDKDKLERVVMDELKAAGVCQDDRQIVEGGTTKDYASLGCEPGVKLYIAEIDVND